MITSARDFSPTFGAAEFSEVYRNMERVYLISLAKATAAPLAPKSDEVSQPDDGKKDEDKKKDDDKKDAKAGEKKPGPVVVDEDGLKERITALPIHPGNYRDLRLVDDRVFYLRAKEAGDDDEEECPGNR